MIDTDKRYSANKSHPADIKYKQLNKCSKVSRIVKYYNILLTSFPHLAGFSQNQDNFFFFLSREHSLYMHDDPVSPIQGNLITDLEI